MLTVYQVKFRARDLRIWLTVPELSGYFFKFTSNLQDLECCGTINGEIGTTFTTSASHEARDLEFEFPSSDIPTLIYFEKKEVEAILHSAEGDSDEVMLYRVAVKMPSLGLLDDYQSLLMLPAGGATEALFAAESKDYLDWNFEEAIDYAIGKPCPPIWKDEWSHTQAFRDSLKKIQKTTLATTREPAGPRFLNGMGRIGYSIFEGVGRLVFGFFHALANGAARFSSKK